EAAQERLAGRSASTRGPVQRAPAALAGPAGLATAGLCGAWLPPAACEPQPRGDSPAGDPPERFGDDSLAHLALAPLALDEGDRALGDRQPRPDGPPGEVDLEAVSLGVHVVQVDAAQRGRAEDAVAAGRVVELEPEHQPRVGVAAARQ